MKKSISQRIKFRKSGKISRRSMGLGHSRSNKTGIQAGRRKKSRGLDLPVKTLNRYL